MAGKRKTGLNSPFASAWRASRAGLSAVMIFSACFNLLKFAVPLYLLQVLDRIPASRSVETLVMLTAVTLAAVAAGLGIDIVRRRMLTRWGVWIENRFGPALVHRGLSSAKPDQAAALNRLLGDLGKLRGFVTRYAVSWLDVIWAPVFFIGVFLIHPLLGTVALLAVVALIFLGVLQDALTRDPRRASSEAYREAGEIVSSAERNRESVAALSMAPTLTERWRRTSSGRLAERERIEARLTVFKTLIRGLGDSVRIAMIGFGIWLFLQNALTLGGIFAARVMAGFGFGLAEKAVRNWRVLCDAGNAYRNVKQALSAGDQKPASVLPGTMEAPIAFDLVSFRYPGEREDVFKRMSLEVAPGELLVVTGSAATGKTTLSRLLVGLLEPRFGQIRIGDVEIARLPEEVRCDLVGYLPQHIDLFNGTVRDNIARMGDGPLKEVIDAAKLVGIHDLIVRLPDGYDTPVTADAFGLSGSERKRIALARAFFKRPRLIVLDEPSANLDGPSRRIMENALRELKAHGSTIVVTQAIQSSQMSRLADKFLILGGRTPEVTVARDEEKPAEPSKKKLRTVK